MAMGGVPTGTILMFGSSIPPEGFLVCNGAAISRTGYSALFSVIGTAYGVGDNSTTFNLPNFTDRLPEGNTTGYREAGLPDIHGELAVNTQWNIVNGSGAFNAWYDAPANSADGSTYHTGFATTRYHFNASGWNGIYGRSGTVQPPVCLCFFIIKY